MTKHLVTQSPRQALEFHVVPDDERPAPFQSQWDASEVHAAILEGKTLFIVCDNPDEAKRRANSIASWARNLDLRIATRIRERKGEVGFYTWLRSE
jgi:hypothetical protein